jgi:hypothetical protein
VARRSPTNARYQKHGLPEGKTRKSAAAAKPKRSSGSPAAKPSAGKSEYSKERKEAAMAAWRSPADPEYRRWRTIWWGIFGAAIVMLGASLVANMYFKSIQASSLLSWASLGLLGIGFFLDLRKIRPIREAASDAVLNPKRASRDAEKPVETDDTTDQS